MLPEEEGNMSWDKEEVLDISGRTPEYTMRTDTLDVKPSSFVQFRSELRSDTDSQSEAYLYACEQYSLHKDLGFLHFRFSVTILVLI